MPKISVFPFNSLLLTSYSTNLYIVNNTHREMLSWLRGVRNLLPELDALESRVTLVLGNMACDLDSGVSSLVLAFHRASTSHRQRMVIPVMNIPRQDFILKTELVTALEEEGITEDLLVFRDDFYFSCIPDLQLILVDHNVISDQDKRYEDKIVEIIDHHVRETQGDNSIIEPVGSCSSLVLRQIWKETPEFKDETCLRLVHETILVDTVALSPEAKKVTPLDTEMVEKCEAILGTGKSRDEIYRHLDNEKRRVDHLNVKQLLRRDFKTFESKKFGTICVCSVPMLAKDWVELPGVERHVKSFQEDEGFFRGVLVLGSSFQGSVPQRDMILANFKWNSDIYPVITYALENSSDPPLQLEKMYLQGLDNFTGYNQGNIGASRKQILPILKNAL